MSPPCRELGVTCMERTAATSGRITSVYKWPDSLTLDTY